MKRLLALLLLLPGLALAQTWTLPTPTVTGTPAPGGTIQIKATFIASSAITASLNIEVHDPGNAKVLPQNWVPSVAVPAGVTGVTETLTWPVPATAVVGSTYSIGFGAYSATTSGNLAWNQNTTFKIVAAGSTTPPPVTTPPTVTQILTAQLPTCWPTVVSKADGGIDAPMVIGAIPPGIEAATNPTYDSFAVALCNYNSKFIVTAVLFKKSFAVTAEAFEYAAGLQTVAQLNAAYLAQATPYTAAETSYLYFLRGRYRPRAVVGYGATTAGTVFTLNADGTRNTTPVAGEGVLPGAPCDTNDKIPSDQNYFSVAGQPNVATGTTPAVLPAGTYGFCGITSEIGWNNP